MQVLGLLHPRDPRSVGEVREQLEARGNVVAYTTVMTVLTRLHAKGVVAREKDGNRYLYRAAGGAARVKAGVLARLSRALFDSDRLRPIAELVEHDLSADELAALKKLVDARLREKRK